MKLITRYPAISFMLIVELILAPIVGFAIVSADPPDSSYPIIRRESYQDGVFSGAVETGVSASSTEVVIVTYDEDNIETSSRAATQPEIDQYMEFYRESQRQDSRSELVGAVTTLRSWADDAETTTSEWDGLTQAQKDQRIKILIGRLGTFFDRFADLLVADNRDPQGFDSLP